MCACACTMVQVLMSECLRLQFGEALKEHKWPAELKAGLIGSCTNSSYEDMQRAASVCRQALAAGIKSKVCFELTMPSACCLLTARAGSSSLRLDLCGPVASSALGQPASLQLCHCLITGHHWDCLGMARSDCSTCTQHAHPAQ